MDNDQCIIFTRDEVKKLALFVDEMGLIHKRYTFRTYGFSGHFVNPDDGRKTIADLQKLQERMTAEMKRLCACRDVQTDVLCKDVVETFIVRYESAVTQLAKVLDNKSSISDGTLLAIGLSCLSAFVSATQKKLQRLIPQT